MCHFFFFGCLRVLFHDVLTRRSVLFCFLVNEVFFLTQRSKERKKLNVTCVLGTEPPRARGSWSDGGHDRAGHTATSCAGRGTVCTSRLGMGHVVYCTGPDDDSWPGQGRNGDAVVASEDAHTNGADSIWRCACGNNPGCAKRGAIHYECARGDGRRARQPNGKRGVSASTSRCVVGDDRFGETAAGDCTDGHERDASDACGDASRYGR